MAMIETYYRIMKHNSEGKLISDSGLILSRSYVLQFLQYFEAILSNTDVSAKDVDGITSVLVDVDDTANTKGRIDAAVGDDTYGIVVGTNDTPTVEDNENYKLDTKILHSDAGEAGKLHYMAMILIAPGVVGANVEYDISRPFLNETDATITVKEIGIIIKNTTDTKYHLILRDVVTDEPVEAGYTLTVVYTLITSA